MLIEAIVLAVGVGSVVSYETTGKGLADHAISSVTNKDCKIARVVHNEQVCQTTEPQGSVIVSAPNPPVASNTIARANDIFAERARKYNEGNKTR
jgi:hypothetical protein